MARDDQPGEDVLPRDLEQALRASRAALESNVAGKLDLEAGLAAILDRKPAATAPAANPALAMSFEDFVRSRSEVLYGFAYVLTGHRDDAEDLVQEAQKEFVRSWDKHAEGIGLVEMEMCACVAISEEHARRVRRRRRAYPVGELKNKIGGPAIDDADAEFMLRAIDQMPRHMRDALALLFLNNMTVLDNLTVDEVAKRLGL